MPENHFIIYSKPEYKIEPDNIIVVNSESDLDKKLTIAVTSNSLLAHNKAIRKFVEAGGIYKGETNALVYRETLTV